MLFHKKWTWIGLVVICLLGMGIVDGRAGGSGPETFPIHGRKPFPANADVIYQKDAWRLEIFLTSKGTRSQGSMGTLSHKGTPVAGKMGEVKDIAIGKVQYKGPESGRKQLWDSTGWVMLEPRVSPISSQMRTEPFKPGREKNISDLAREFDQMNQGN